MSIAKRIPDEPSMQRVDIAFTVLCGLESFEIFKDQLPPNLRKYNATDIDTIRWVRHGQIGGKDYRFLKSFPKFTVY